MKLAIIPILSADSFIANADLDHLICKAKTVGFSQPAIDSNLIIQVHKIKWCMNRSLQVSEVAHAM